MQIQNKENKDDWVHTKVESESQSEPDLESDLKLESKLKLESDSEKL